MKLFWLFNCGFHTKVREQGCRDLPSGLGNPSFSKTIVYSAANIQPYTKCKNKLKIHFIL